MHRILARQLRNAGLDPDHLPEDPAAWKAFLERVGATYEARDRDRHPGERALQLSSTEVAALSEEQNDARLELAEQHRKLECIFRYLGDGLCVFDAQGRPVLINPVAERTLLSSDDDRAVEQWFEQTDPSGELRARVIAGEEIRASAAEFRRSCGATLSVAYALTPIRGESGVTGMVLVFRDITDEKRIETQLRASERAARAAANSKSEFLASMSHELRTPMNAILGATGLLLESDLDEEQREYALMASESSQGLLDIINDILDYSKIEVGRLEIESRPFDLMKCIEVSLGLVGLAASEKDLEIGYRMDESVPERLKGDRIRVGQVLVNLVSNAVKFTKEGGVFVDISSRPEGSGTRILCAVRDTGIGIPADVRERIFESFTQVDASTTREFGGTGLGLTISRRLAKLMDGDLHVDSEPGVGSTFTFEFVAEPDGSHRMHRSATDGTRPTCAIVTDSEIQRLVIESHVVGLGFQPVAIDECMAARGDLSARVDVDAIVIDDKLPESLRQELHAAMDANPPGVRRIRLARGPYVRLHDDNDNAAAFSIGRPVRRCDLARAIGVTESENQQSIESCAAADAANGQCACRVLVADDNVFNRRLLERLLAAHDIAADLALDGNEALAAIEGTDYDLVLMDVYMPELDGLEVTRRVRARLPRERQPRIVALTADEYHESYREAGMDGYLAKPIDRAALAKLLSDLPTTERSRPPRS